MSIETVPVTERDIPLLYSLAREDFPDLSPDGWESFVAPYLDDMLHGGLCGVMAARATMLNKYRGLFLYSVETTLGCPRALVISHTILPQSFGSDLIADKFVESWRELAARHDCGLIKASLAPATADGLLPKFGKMASVEAVCLCMTVSSALQSRKRQRFDGRH